MPKAFDIDSRTAPPCSVQCRSLLIAPSLYVAGFGGSVPGYKDGKHYFDGNVAVEYSFGFFYGVFTLIIS